MLNLGFGKDARLALCIGAHCDDIEIGCGGALWSLARKYPQIEFVIAVFASDDARERETRGAIERILGVAKYQLVVHRYRDGFFPAEWASVKGSFEALKSFGSPDVVLTHQENDRHQDHRIISELTWNTFRNHLVLEYEIPKYDGDLGQPNAYMSLSDEAVEQKIAILMSSFPSQTGKRWFTQDLFRGLMRIRGMECNAPSGYAEAFYARKMLLDC
jgi:LmbE family N-acetylglucosaminyl deacetylase